MERSKGEKNKYRGQGRKNRKEAKEKFQGLTWKESGPRKVQLSSFICPYQPLIFLNFHFQLRPNNSLFWKIMETLWILLFWKILMNIAFLENSVFFMKVIKVVFGRSNLEKKKIYVSLSPGYCFYSTAHCNGVSWPKWSYTPISVMTGLWLFIQRTLIWWEHSGFPAVFSVLEAKTDESNALDNWLEKGYLFQGQSW